MKCKHGCGTELWSETVEYARPREEHTPERCQRATRAQLDEANKLRLEHWAAAREYMRLRDAAERRAVEAEQWASGLQSDCDALGAKLDIATAKLAEAERKAAELRGERLLKNVEEGLNHLYGMNRVHDSDRTSFEAAKSFFIAALAADSAPEAGKRCDECDWTFGCFNGSAQCRKYPPAVKTEKEGP